MQSDLLDMDEMESAMLSEMADEVLPGAGSVTLRGKTLELAIDEPEGACDARELAKRAVTTADDYGIEIDSIAVTHEFYPEELGSDPTDDPEFEKIVHDLIHNNTTVADPVVIVAASGHPLARSICDGADEDPGDVYVLVDKRLALKTLHVDHPQRDLDSIPTDRVPVLVFLEEQVMIMGAGYSAVGEA